MPSRRTFLQTSAISLGALGGLLRPPRAVARVPRSEALRILILGGTGFTGPFMVRHAVERGHQVTTFNRGRRSTELPDSVEQLRGDTNIVGGRDEIVAKAERLVALGAQRLYLQLMDLQDVEHVEYLGTEVLPHLPR